MKSKLKTYFILFIYALCLAYLWGECFRTYESNQITCGIGLVLTFVSAYFIQKQFDFKLDLWQKLFFILLMFGYSSIFLKADGVRLFLFSPQFLAILFLIFNFFVFKDLRKFYNNIFFVLLTITYTNSYFSGYHSYYWEPLNERSIIIDSSENKTIEKKQTVPDEVIDISSFSFLDLKSDTVNIQSDKPYIFIQTWNEKCPPCKLAIKELTPMLDTIKNQVDSYFIYENLKFDKNVFVKSAKKKDGLSNQKVLADFSQEFYNSMKMHSYPVFFIIDNKEGKIIYMTVGYGGKASKKKWIEKLKEISKM
ncbi:MAG: hypothetical protein WBA59_10870 [Moheibacter sp.]